MVASIGGRMVGVRIPEAQGREMSDLPTNSVVQLVEMKICGVGIVDDTGSIVSTVAYRVGAEWWTDPNGEAWMKGLLRAGKDLSEELEDAYSQQSGKEVSSETVKSAVKVNLVGARIDKQAKTIANAK